jgi:multisubunit Na+/H+ antiporter MnhG subunit
MSNAAKQNFFGAVCVLCAIFMVFCIGRMIPPGLAGEIHAVIVYFIFMTVAFAASLPAGVAYYYYRGSKSEDRELVAMRAQVEALASMGHRPNKSRVASSGPSVRRTRKHP